MDWVPFDKLEKGKSYPFIDFPIEHMVAMQLRLEQEGWCIADRLPEHGVDLPPIRDGDARRHGLDWVEPAKVQTE